MKIYGISMVRNEADIIRLTVLHNLSLGLDGILILDNGSTDGTAEVLQELGKEDERVRWIRDDSPYNQAAMMTELAREVHRQGADWILPFDADEFWWGKRGNFRKILADSEAGALAAFPINFVQAVGQHESTPEGLLTMTRRVVETFPHSKLAHQLVELHQISYVQVAYPPKWICRPTGEIEIRSGNHSVVGVRGEPEISNRIECFHALLRSRADLESKMERERRRIEAGKKNYAWHVWYWARMVEQGRMDQEWAANSYEGEYLNVYGDRYPVVFDSRLRNLVAPFLPRASRNPSAVRRALGGVARRMRRVLER
jgi:glycosyltransferase involved in cell wall biosynthesis